jgi:hypothetical protein
LLVACDTVVLGASFRGTDTWVRLAVPDRPDGHEWAVTIMHFDGGKVVREWIGADKLCMFIQLGVLEDSCPT